MFEEKKNHMEEKIHLFMVLYCVDQTHDQGSTVICFLGYSDNEINYKSNEEKVKAELKMMSCS